MMKQVMMIAAVTMMGAAASAATTTCAILGQDANGEYNQILASKEVDFDAESTAIIGTIGDEQVVAVKQNGNTIVALLGSDQQMIAGALSNGTIAALMLKSHKAMVLCAQR